MGASKNLALVNTTIELQKHSVTHLESFLDTNFNLISYKIVSDTNELWEKDEHFRKLVKAEKQARIVKEKYINEKN